VTRHDDGMSTPARACVAAVILLLPVSAFAQDGVYIQGRLDGMQRQLSELSARIEELKAQDQQLQQRLEGMRTSVEARVQRLEKGGAGSGRR